MQKLIKPDWKNSILNISATLAEFLGAPNENATLQVLQNELAKGYKNVVFICFDGMGINPLEINLEENDFMRKHIVKTLTSTFPSTTTNATTSLATNKLPLEHGWLGWSLHFDELGRNVDIYPRRDSQTGEEIVWDYPIIDDGDCYFYHATRADYEISTVFPQYVACKKELNHEIQGVDDVFVTVREICNKPNKQFVYAYCPEPDYSMHEFGVTSPEAKKLIRLISEQLQKLQKETKDTLFIVSADHGQVDIEGYIDIAEDKELQSMLECPLYLDARSPAFKVKRGKKRLFQKLFNERYGKDYVLYKTRDLIKRGYFGDRGEYGYLLGDFVASGTYTHKMFISPKDGEEMFYMKGHHTALTEEMLVPLIIFNS